MSASPITSFAPLSSYAHAARTSAALAVAATRLAYVDAFIQGEDTTTLAAAVADAEAMHEHARAAIAHATRRADEAEAEAEASAALERQRCIDALTETVRAALATGPARESEIASVVRARRELVHDALRALLVRGEVARAGRGYCLVPAQARTLSVDSYDCSAH